MNLFPGPDDQELAANLLVVALAAILLGGFALYMAAYLR